MSKRKGARTLGLCFLAVLGLLAFMAAGAQANWLVLHNEKIVEPHVELEVETHEHKTGNKFKLLVPGANLEILCLFVDSDPQAPPLLLAANIIGHGHVIFSTCDTWVGGKELPACKPVEPILAGGLGTLILHVHKGADGKEVKLNYVLLEPLKGQPFAVISFTGFCALPKAVEITGRLVVECGHLLEGKFALLDCAKHEVTQLFREAPEELFKEDQLFYGVQRALLDGIAAARIEFPLLYVGDKWGGHV